MISVVKKAKTSVFLMLLMVAIAAAILPTTAALAESVTLTSQNPYRSWGIYIYAKGHTVADFQSPWMEIHAQLWEREPEGWYLRVEKVTGGEWLYSLTSTARMTHVGGGTFQTLSYHEWDWSDYTYNAAWTASEVVDL